VTAVRGEVLFLPYSAWGHVAPMLAVAAELAVRGVPVSVLAAERYRAAIAAAGAQAVVPATDRIVRVPAGLRPHELVDRGRLWFGRRSVRGDTLRTLRPRLQCGRSVLCVVDPHLRIGGRLFEVNRAPAVQFWTTYPRWRSGRSGLALANLLPDLWPGGVQYEGIRSVGPLICDHPVADAAPVSLPRRGRLLVVSPGTVFARSAEFFRTVIAAFAGSEWTVVLATTHLPVEVLGPLPSNIHAYSWIRQGELVRRADVLLTHGGISSVQEAILAGTPMVLAPRSREQCRTVRRVCALGGGVWLRADRLRAQVEQLVVDPVVRARLGELQARAAARAGAAIAADMLMDIADHRLGL